MWKIPPMRYIPLCFSYTFPNTSLFFCPCPTDSFHLSPDHNPNDTNQFHCTWLYIAMQCSKYTLSVLSGHFYLNLIILGGRKNIWYIFQHILLGLHSKLDYNNTAFSIHPAVQYQPCHYLVKHKRNLYNNVIIYEKY